MTQSFTTLKVKCPHCYSFLKDENVQIDDRDSIKLNIDANGKKGNIWISAKYASDKYETDIEVEDKTIVKFYCPFCTHELITDIDCWECKAPMASFYLSNGGVINFCTRQGCNKNSIEFPEFTFEESKLEKEVQEKEKLSFSIRNWFKKQEVITVESVKESMLEQRTYLHSYCPHCKRNLTDFKSFSLKIYTQDGKMGFLILSPYLGESMLKSTVKIEDNEVLKEIHCPYCDTNLVKPDKICKTCGSAVAGLYVPGDNKLIEYCICTKKGCFCHGLDKDDIIDIKSAYISVQQRAEKKKKAKY